MQLNSEQLCAQVSTVNLERVRKVKTRHQRLLSRVTTVREELERFLEDDDDMAKMCLTRRREVLHRLPLTVAKAEPIIVHSSSSWYAWHCMP